MSSVAAVVVTYNRKELLLKCLKSLLQQTTPLAKVYVIDNASTDGTCDSIPAHHKIEYIKLEKNLGGSYGFACGIEQALKASYDGLWIMDDDCFPEDNALEELLKYRQECGVLCSAVLARDGQYDLNHRRSFDLNTLNDQVIEGSAYEQSCFRIDVFSFVGALISTDVIKRVGLPVDNYFYMSDDTEYALRIAKHNIQACVVPSSRIWHHGSLTYPSAHGKYSSVKQYYYFRNKLLVYRKYSTSRSWYILRFFTTALRAYLGLIKHRELSLESFVVTTQALCDAARGRAFVRSF